MDTARSVATEKIREMPVDQVIRLLIFMAGMDAAQAVTGKADDPGQVTALSTQDKGGHTYGR